jgi:hypothetical protein
MLEAKAASLWAQAAAALVIILGLFLKGIKAIDLPMDDILVGAVGVAGVFSPVYASIITDKVRGRGREEKDG